MISKLQYIVNFLNSLWIKIWCRPFKQTNKQTNKQMYGRFLLVKFSPLCPMFLTYVLGKHICTSTWLRICQDQKRHQVMCPFKQTNKQMYGRFLLVKFSPLCPMTVSNSLGNHICRSTWLGICQEDQKGHQVTHCTALTTLVCAAASGS